MQDTIIVQLAIQCARIQYIRCDRSGDGSSFISAAFHRLADELAHAADANIARLIRAFSQLSRSGGNNVGSIVVRPEEGRSLSLGGMGVVFRLFGQDTAESFAVVEHPVEAGRLTWPHVHTREDEYSYVLEGVIGARVGDQVIEAVGVGSYLRKPRGVPHAFWNPGPKPARLLEIISPPGFEAYFVELAEAGDPHRREELAQKYGVTYFSDWIPDLTAKYKLKLLGL